MIAWIATTGGLLGAALVSARRPLAGNLVWCVANPLWVAWAVVEDEPQVGVLFGAYTLLALAGAWNYWRARKEHGMKRVTYECDGDGCTKTRGPGDLNKQPNRWEVVEIASNSKRVFLHFCPDCWQAAQIALRLGGDSC